MPRSARVAPGGMVFHVINRGIGRMDLFEKEQDYIAFDADKGTFWFLTGRNPSSLIDGKHEGADYYIASI